MDKKRQKEGGKKGKNGRKSRKKRKIMDVSAPPPSYSATISKPR